MPDPIYDLQRQLDELQAFLSLHVHKVYNDIVAGGGMITGAPTIDQTQIQHSQAAGA